ncbi:DUF6582 domain-containing protein [Deinococcus sp. PESE-13]
MSELSEKKRDDLPNHDFAYIDAHGGRHLPIHDEEHVRNAAARFDQTQFASAKDRAGAASKIKAAAKRHGVTLSDDDAVMQAK